jgi:hypothetical protein
MIETKVMSVTPAMARAWLERNTINRPLRRSAVSGMKAAYVRGEHKLTHQGIAFADSGELLDGQHRLSAIAEMPESFSVKIMVTSGLDRDAFEGIDIGIRRSPADVLRMPQGLVGTARYLATIIETSRAGITPQYIVPFALGTEEQYDKLIGFCPKNTKVWSSASVRAAAVLQLLRGSDPDYVCITYHALNHAEFDSMSRIAQSMYRQQVRGLISTKSYDMFCRAFKVFDPASASIDKLQITDTSGILGAARELIREHIIGNAQKKAGAVLRPAKKANSANSTRRVPA